MIGRQHLLICLLPVSEFIIPRTHRASGLFRSACAVVDRRAPNMPLGTEPPDAPVTACRYLLGCQGAIQFGVPLSRHFRVGSGKVIEPCQHFLSRTVGAVIGAPGPVHHLGPPLMAQMTLLPDIAITARHDLARGQRPVFGGVPLGGNGRIQGL